MTAKANLSGKAINGSQLQQEIGAESLYVSDSDIYAEGISQKQLEDGLAAHTPDPDYGKDAEELKLEDYKAKAEAGTLTSSDIAPALSLFLKLRA